METGSESPPFQDFDSEDTDTSAELQFEDSSALSIDETEERGEKSKNTTAPASRVQELQQVLQEVLPPRRGQGGQSGEPLTSGSPPNQSAASSVSSDRMGNVDGVQPLSEPASSLPPMVTERGDPAQGAPPAPGMVPPLSTGPPSAALLVVPSFLPPPTMQQQPSRPTSPSQWPSIAAAAILKAQDCIFPYRNKRARPSTLEELKATAKQILEVLRCAQPNCNEAQQAEISSCRADISEIIADLEDRSFDHAEDLRRSNYPDSPAARRSPLRQPRDQSPPTHALSHAESTVRFLLQLIADDELPDVGSGSAVDDEALTFLYDIRVKEIHKIIKECRDATGKYAALSGSSLTLITKSQKQSARAYAWTQKVVQRFRQSQLHLEGNSPAKEATFKMFDPSGDGCIYQFLSQYEEWAHGYLSNSAKARLLFTKYLPPSLTEVYEELILKRNDYQAMKNWLIDVYGSVKEAADMRLRSISKLKPPKSSDGPLQHSQYLRKIHKHLSTLFNLEISKGVKVPRLLEYIGSPSFLLQLGKILPCKIKDEWTSVLADKEVIPNNIEGIVHFKDILRILKKRYSALEIKSKISPTWLSDLDSEDDRSPTGKQPANHRQTKLPRWTCPVFGHESHSLKECSEFLLATPKQRRYLCRWQVCWTCFSRDGRCEKGECDRVHEIPKLLVCQECLENSPSGTRPTNILLCGIDHHAKPDIEDIHSALEMWIPGFDAMMLPAPITVGFVTSHATKSRNQPGPRSGSGPSDTYSPMIAYNTCTGAVDEISNRDDIIGQSEEDSFYIMQQLCIAGEPALTFYDSGSNTHLIDGNLAERAGFTVINDKCTRIGVVGGGDIWSEFGSYSCFLGPDTNHKYHEVECQGLARITSSFPKFDLMPIAKEAARIVPRGQDIHYPPSIGGDRVKLLIGVKSTSLAPVLRYSLPGGLGIYHSTLLDVHGSTVCYGGPHEAFTRGYAKAGMSANHLQVLFTEAAISYMRAPYTFVVAEAVNHVSEPLSVPSNLHSDSCGEWCDERDLIPSTRISPSECTRSNQMHSGDRGQCFKASVPQRSTTCVTAEVQQHDDKLPQTSCILESTNGMPVEVNKHDTSPPHVLLPPKKRFLNAWIQSSTEEAFKSPNVSSPLCQLQVDESQPMRNSPSMLQLQCIDQGVKLKPISEKLHHVHFKCETGEPPPGLSNQ